MKFKDNFLQEQFNEIGFVKVPFLTNNEIALLKDYITENTPIVQKSNEIGFFQGVFIDGKEIKVNLHNYIKSIIEGKLLEFIDEFKVIIYTALAKGSGQNSKLELHQDSSFVDESSDFSISIWIPLSDSNSQNGAMHYLENSHKTYPNIRCATVIHDYGDFEEIKESMKCIDVKAGELLFFNPRILHYTPNNLTEENRIAVMAGLINPTSDILQWYKINDTRLEVFKMKDDFFLDYDNFTIEKDQRPNGEKIGEIEVTPFKPIFPFNKKRNNNRFIFALSKLKGILTK